MRRRKRARAANRKGGVDWGRVRQEAIQRRKEALGMKWSRPCFARKLLAWKGFDWADASWMRDRSRFLAPECGLAEWILRRAGAKALPRLIRLGFDPLCCKASTGEGLLTRLAKEGLWLLAWELMEACRPWALSSEMGSLEMGRALFERDLLVFFEPRLADRWLDMLPEPIRALWLDRGWDEFFGCLPSMHWDALSAARWLHGRDAKFSEGALGLGKLLGQLARKQLKPSLFMDPQELAECIELAASQQQRRDFEAEIRKPQLQACAGSARL